RPICLPCSMPWRRAGQMRRRWYAGLARPRSANSTARRARWRRSFAHGAAHGEIVAFRMTAGAPTRHRILFLATQIAAYRLGCALLPLGQQHPPAQTRAQIEALGARFVIDATAALDDLPGWAVGAHRERITDFGDAVLT